MIRDVRASESLSCRAPYSARPLETIVCIQYTVRYTHLAPLVTQAKRP
jgi:hypothetical protein